MKCAASFIGAYIISQAVRNWESSLDMKVRIISVNSKTVNRFLPLRNPPLFPGMIK